jgi:hypothetical protein
MLGTWCLQKNGNANDTISLYERKQECDQQRLVIGPDSYHSYEGDDAEAGHIGCQLIGNIAIVRPSRFQSYTNCVMLYRCSNSDA